MTIHIQSSALTHPGRKRSSNQDFVTFFEPIDLQDLQASGNLYIVADGVGGAAKGDRASQYAAQKVLHDYYRHPQVEIGERLQASMRRAGNEIYSFAERSSGFRMATTMVAAVVKEDKLTVANVGDSRAYLFRDGVAKQITRDHSLVGEMVRDGVMTEEEARHSRIKNRITRSLGGETNVHVDVFREIPLKLGDKILLCSDGFSQYAQPGEIAQLISQGQPEDITEDMIDYALRRGGSDNISTIIIEVIDPDSEIDTMRVKRGQIPREVDWETMDTAPALKMQYQRPNMWLPPLENWQLIAGIAVVILLLGLLSWVIFLWGSSDEKQVLSPSETAVTLAAGVEANTTDTPVSTPSNTSVIPSNTPTPTDTPRFSATPSGTFTATNTVETSATATFTATEMATATQTETPQGEAALPAGQAQPGKHPNCRVAYEEKSDDIGFEARYLTEYVTGTKFVDNAEFREFAPGIKCAEIEHNPCQYDGDNSPHFLGIGWVLDFPDIPPKQCEAAGGTPQPPESDS